MSPWGKIPDELRARPQWVCYRHDKTPVDPKTGKPAKAGVPETWGTYEQAVKRYEGDKDNGIAGVGFEFSGDDPFTGIDLDKCRDPQTGKTQPWAQKIIEQMASYTEISPSGTGFHVNIRGKLPPGANGRARWKCTIASDILP